MRIAWAVALSIGLVAPLAAQEQTAPEETPVHEEEAPDFSILDDEPAPARRPLRVLRHPYELSSFYRSDGRSSFSGDAGIDPYALPGYYRSAPPPAGSGYDGPLGAFGMGHYGYGGGYAPLAPARRGRRGHVRRPLGHNGEWWLLAPTVLAPIGPLTGADWSR